MDNQDIRNSKSNSPNGSKKKNGIKSLFNLSPKAWQWAIYVLVMVTMLIWFGVIFSIPPASLHVWSITLGFAVIAGGLSLLLGHLVITLLNLFQKVPNLFRWLMVGSMIVLFNLLYPLFNQLYNVIFIITYVVIFSCLLGAGIGGLKGKDAKKPGQRGVAFGALLLGITGIMGAAAWVLWPGPVHDASWFTDEPTGTPALTVEDPSQEGSYTVLTLTYGSGSDKQRPEYGDGVDIQTGHVDVSPMVQGGLGIIHRLRQSYWGFDLSSVPLNARVWYPEGDGPFPLILIVHGNHAMDDFSDPGYDYLGELLGSRGYIVASVDQNFLNTSGMHEAVLGELQGENDARGYLLLQHLSLWHGWNQTQNHQFYGKVDTGKIALAGHSRGGEAAAIAAAFNHLPAHPDNFDIPFDFGYDIGAVITIAPSDGQYQPRKQRTPLEDVSYLVLQGSADSDVRSFQGSRQYDRVEFSEDHSGFKASVYIHNANHGQFNTRWGRIDMNASLWFLNRRQIMPVAEQETAAKIFISAFLEAALHGRHEYERLFENPLAAQSWLPDTIYLSQYESSETLILADFEEDLNLETTTIPGGRLKGINLTTWREEPPYLGTGSLRDTVSVRLGWNQDLEGPGAYNLELPADLTLEDNYKLTFSMANLSRDKNPIDITIKVTDQSGQEAALPLSHAAPLPPVLPYRMYKPPLRVAFEWEPVFTTYSFKLRDFEEVNRSFNLENLKSVQFIFDRTPAGEIYLDDLGFRSI